MVALLRGVNVRGRGKLAMADLRTVVESCGPTDVRTYVQSGNVVFETTERSGHAVADQLATALADQTDTSPAVVVRTRAQLATVVEGNPFLDRDDDPTHHHVVFMGGTQPASVGSLDLEQFAPEDAAAVSQELYLYLPTGMARSKLAVALGRQGGDGGSAQGTARNWRTVTKLLDLADDLS